MTPSSDAKEREQQARERREMKRVERFVRRHSPMLTLALMLLSGVFLLLFLALASTSTIWAALAATFPLRWGIFTTLSGIHALSNERILSRGRVWYRAFSVTPGLAAGLWLGGAGLPAWALLVPLLAAISEDLALGCLNHVPEPSYPLGRPCRPPASYLGKMLKSEPWMLIATVAGFVGAWMFRYFLF
jgi:hypothetical protein